MSRTEYYKPFFHKVIWDYDISQINLDKEDVFIWFLERKITYDGLEGIRKKDFITYGPKLNIDESYTIVLNKYFL